MMTPADVAQLINGSRIADRLTGTVAELLDQDQTVAIAQLATELAACNPLPASGSGHVTNGRDVLVELGPDDLAVREPHAGL